MTEKLWIISEELCDKILNVNGNDKKGEKDEENCEGKEERSLIKNINRGSRLLINNNHYDN